MNTAIIMLGSNTSPDENIELAREMIANYFEIVAESSLLISKAKGVYKSDFQNIALKILSDEHADETRLIFKQIEIDMGRKPDSKKEGLIPIDIDLIIWNDTLVHDDYNRFDFVKICVDEIA